MSLPTCLFVATALTAIASISWSFLIVVLLGDINMEAAIKEMEGYDYE